MTLSLYDLADHWFAQSPTSRAWTVSAIVVSLTGILWGLFGRSPARARLSAVANGKAVVCPPEQLKDDLATLKDGNGVANAYTLDREISVPFDVGDVRVSKILVHPIKVRQFAVHRYH